MSPTELQPNSISKSTGLPIRQFMTAVFEQNELTTEHITDEQIEQLVRDEFAECPEVLESLDNLSAVSVTSRIRLWRSEFNRGLWVEQPKYFSFRYGPDNIPINRHLNPFTPEKIKSAILSHPTDPRKENYAGSIKT